MRWAAEWRLWRQYWTSTCTCSDARPRAPKGRPKMQSPYPSHARLGALVDPSPRKSRNRDRFNIFPRRGPPLSARQSIPLRGALWVSKRQGPRSCSHPPRGRPIRKRQVAGRSYRVELHGTPPWCSPRGGYRYGGEAPCRISGGPRLVSPGVPWVSELEGRRMEGQSREKGCVPATAKSNTGVLADEFPRLPTKATTCGLPPPILSSRQLHEAGNAASRPLLPCFHLLPQRSAVSFTSLHQRSFSGPHAASDLASRGRALRCITAGPITLPCVHSLIALGPWTLLALRTITPFQFEGSSAYILGIRWTAALAGSTVAERLLPPSPDDCYAILEASTTVPKQYTSEPTRGPPRRTASRGPLSGRRLLAPLSSRPPSTAVCSIANDPARSLLDTSTVDYFAGEGNRLVLTAGPTRRSLVRISSGRI